MTFFIVFLLFLFLFSFLLDMLCNFPRGYSPIFLMGSSADILASEFLSSEIFLGWVFL